MADTSALFAMLNMEDEAEDLASCAVRAGPVLLSTASFAELGILTASRFGRDGSDRLEGLLADLIVSLVDLDAGQARMAISAYRRFGKGSGSPARLNFGDCFSYALAKSRALPLLFKGDDFIHTDIGSAREAVLRPR